ncbi:hypothetical protein [Methyloterricola oryzae]|nr:hypothetical protein [Methyloterricola oryzae]
MPWLKAQALNRLPSEAIPKRVGGMIEKIGGRIGFGGLQFIHEQLSFQA